jgi:hypothetical protein
MNRNRNPIKKALPLTHLTLLKRQISDILVYQRGKPRFAKYPSKSGWYLHTAATTTTTAAPFLLCWNGVD